jgi:hypothetical protein
MYCRPRSQPWFGVVVLQRFIAKMLETNVLVEAVGAAEGGLIALYCTMPIETVQKTQIAEKSKGHDKHSFGDIAAKIRSESGVLGFYRGIGVLSSMVASEKFIYYMLYTLLKNKIESNKPGSVSLPVTICLGYLADLGRLPVTMPLDLLSTRMQTSSRGSLLSVAREILRTRGFSGFYEGWRAYLGLAVKPALQVPALPTAHVTITMIHHAISPPHPCIPGKHHRCALPHAAPRRSSSSSISSWCSTGGAGGAWARRCPSRRPSSSARSRGCSPRSAATPSSSRACRRRPACMAAS